MYKISKSKVNQETGLNYNIKTTQTSSSSKKISKDWEIVYRNSDRWNELGFGSGDKFPGYGKLFDRELKVWCCEIGSKEIKEEKIIKDRFPYNYEPKEIESIVGDNIYFDWLENKKGYEYLKTGVDNKNRKRWYIALTKATPTGIQIERELEKEEIEEEITIPNGWTLIRRNTKEWFDYGFGDGEKFPGYGKIFERTFDVWYCQIGEKEKHLQTEFKDKAILNFYNGICGNLGELSDKGLSFESLERKQGYKQLLTTVDPKERKRWYFGLKEYKPTQIFTAKAK